jgi:glycosyl transferase family 25
MGNVGIIVISKPESRRHSLIRNHLTGLGMQASVAPAVFLAGPAERTAGYDHASRLRNLGYGLTPGEVGCFLAHRRAWEMAEASGGPSMVLEDDARVDPKLVRSLDELGEAIAGTKIIIRLFSQRHPDSKLWRRLASGIDIIRPNLAGNAAVAYMLTPEAARALLNSSVSFWQTVDDHMDDEESHGCAIMHLLPELVRHEDEESSLIGTRRKPRIPLWAKLRREWLRALRKLRHSRHRGKTDRALGLR